VIGLYAVIAAGGVYTGCYSSLPFRELKNRVVGAESVFLVASGDNLETAQKVAQTCDHVKKLFVIDDETKGHSEVVPFSLLLERDPTPAQGTIPVDVDCGDTAFLLFSSGSTGLPKMVIRSHRNINAHVVQTNHPDVAFASSQDVATIHHPLPHMGGSLGLTVYLCLNTQAVICTGYSTEEYIKLIEKYKVSIVFLVPSHLVLFSKSPLLEKHDLSSIRQILTAGAPLQPNLIEAVNSALKFPGLSQFYGATEMGIPTMSSSKRGSVETIGILVPGFEVKIVDPSSGQALGPNEIGELYARGAQITPGYYKNQGATQASITKDGFFKTGDACYYDEKGLFYIVDRYKELIKVSSYQVAPKELESVLLDHQSVAEVAVIGIPDEFYGQIPKAYVVLKPGHEGQVSDSDLINYVKGEVAEWKQLRGGIQFMTEIPKLGIGKIDRNGLKELKD
jgi:acyl-coenzyme A synthetase/AMP-(fatty) acid ligase